MCRFTIRDLMWFVAGAAALGVGLLLLECGLLIIPEDFKPFGIGGWLLEIAIYRYGILLTVIFTIAALAIVAFLALAPIRHRST
jgi:hypothetical protein